VGVSAVLDDATYQKFRDSNFDAYDTEEDRYPAVLLAGLEANHLQTDDVVAVAHSLGLWAICAQGVFRADMRGVFNKRMTADPLIPYAEIHWIVEELTGPHTAGIVLMGVDAKKKLAKIDFGTEHDHRARIFGILKAVAPDHVTFRDLQDRRRPS
jgi:hypothetical protein